MKSLLIITQSEREVCERERERERERETLTAALDISIHDFRTDSIRSIFMWSTLTKKCLFAFVYVYEEGRGESGGLEIISIMLSNQLSLILLNNQPLSVISEH